LKKLLLLIPPLLAGIALLFFSWYSSFPISVYSTNDYVFNHLPFEYWIGTALVVVSFFLIALTSKNRYAKCFCAVSIVVTMYSSFYFYSFLPGSDSQFFRGLTEYFFQTGKLSQTSPANEYYSWPIFFMLSKIVTDVTGLSLQCFEFILFTCLGILYSISLYVYFSSANIRKGFIAVTAFFIVVFSFLDYQCVPFSLAFALLFLLIMHETYSKGDMKSVLISSLLFLGILFTHFFVPAFYILYKILVYVFTRKREHLLMFLIASISYLAYLFLVTPSVLNKNLQLLLTGSSEIPMQLAKSVSLSTTPLDSVFQLISKFDVVLMAVLCGIGFFILLITKKTRATDKAAFVSGALYLALGIPFLILGSRALPILFFPTAGGIIYLLESRIGKYLIALFVILLLLFSFVLLHTSFYNQQTQFQTTEAYDAANFMLDNYNWTRPSLVLADFSIVPYLTARHPISNSTVDSLFGSVSDIGQYDTIFYTIGLGNALLQYNYTSSKLLQEEPLIIIYDNGFSYVAIKSQNENS
jgi:hypothetical protein